MNKLPFEKPQKRKKDHKLMKRIHSENEYMQCDACKGMFKEYNIHHKVRRSQGGDDDLSNFAFLCKKHDSMLHSSPSQFRSIFGSDLYFELLPSLKNKWWI